ncbi:MAG: ATP-binding cassette domain-containing protein [Phycisphaeraceae bacterium]|nr:ATP-binding cassette domain-containing protein [Phycisphaeraceae bacterium]
MNEAIILEDVCKRFGSKVAVDNVTLQVASGGLYGFIGPNGAGKSTTIRMVMSIIFPDSGRLSVLGRASAVESKDRIGYLPEERGVYRKMKVGAFLAHMARLKGVDGGPALNRKVKDWLERVGLGPEYSKKCEELSKGMQQKVQFIACVLHQPDLLILDEPFSGLDPVNTRLMRELFLEQHRAGVTMIFSTHHMASAEALCDHIIMIHQGVKVLDAEMRDIHASHDPRRIAFRPVDDAHVAAAGRPRGVHRFDQVHQGWEAELAPDADPVETLREISGAIPCTRIELKRPTLEDIFVDIVTGGDFGQSADEVRAALATPDISADNAQESAR